jgi:hypothetical protein
MMKNIFQQLQDQLQSDHPTFAQAIEAGPMEQATNGKFSKELFLERARQRERESQAKASKDQVEV